MNKKWRWTIEGNLPNGKLNKKFIRLNSRPLRDVNNLCIDIIIFDVVDWSQEDLLVLQSSIYKDEVPSLGIFKLTLYDGTATIMEEWELIDAYISIFEFNDYDESSSDAASILMKINYKKVNYKNLGLLAFI